MHCTFKQNIHHRVVMKLTKSPARQGRINILNLYQSTSLNYKIFNVRPNYSQQNFSTNKSCLLTHFTSSEFTSHNPIKFYADKKHNETFNIYPFHKNSQSILNSKLFLLQAGIYSCGWGFSIFPCTAADSFQSFVPQGLPDFRQVEYVLKKYDQSLKVSLLSH